MEREHLAPIRARIDGVLDDVQRVVDGAKHAQESVADVLKHVTGTGTAVAGAVRAKTWPIIGLLQGLKTAASIVMRNGRKASHDNAYESL
jgi:predicted GNAT superfamily acetyltransferase